MPTAFFHLGLHVPFFSSFLGVHPNFWGCNVPSNSSEIESKEGRKTALIRHSTENFEKEIPESDSGTGNDYFWFCR
jgi:hypothetical protein